MYNYDFKDLKKLAEDLEYVKNELMTFSTASEKADNVRRTIFEHISYIALYGVTRDFNHWCNEIANRIDEILGCRINKNRSKKPTNKEVLKYLLSDMSLLDKRFKYFYSRIISDEGEPTNKQYANKYSLYKLIINVLTTLLTDIEAPDSNKVGEVITNVLKEL